MVDSPKISTLRARNHGVESVQSRAGDECRLIVYPQLTDGVKAIGKDNTLAFVRNGM